MGLTTETYVAALHGAGVAEGLPTKEFDRQAAVLLRVDTRTARRYRRGEVAIPGPVAALLELLGARRRKRSRPLIDTGPASA
jgi:hypothetical protein